MKKSILVILAIFAGGIFGAAETHEKNSKSDKEAKITTQTVVAGNSDFAFELYHELRETKGNLFFSPYSISTALALTYAGARNDTEKQMAEALHFDLRQKMFHRAFGKLQKQLNAQGEKGDYQLSVANALWLQKDYELLKTFIGLNKTHYDAGLNRVNFKTQVEKARKTINDWVEKKTNQKIKNLIPAGTLDALTRLVLTNAVYFKGDWASQFEPKDTEEADFYVSSKEKVKADLMYKKADFKYAETDSLQILELPYKGDDLSMVVLLPKRNYDITTLEQSLTTENLSEWLKILHSREVIVHLPKFKLTSRFELAGVLGKMGMPDAFSPRADFSGMTGNKDLFIAAVLHKAYVDVNEEGTEAAAATGVVMKLTAMPAPPPVFRADHPFVFMIKDNTSNSILFIGRLTNPAEKAE
jgi:serpin B